MKGQRHRGSASRAVHGVITFGFIFLISIRNGRNSKTEFKKYSENGFPALYIFIANKPLLVKWSRICCFLLRTTHSLPLGFLFRHLCHLGFRRRPMLPYKTLQEAEAFLGRNLTFPETVWLNYSANKSDYFLYCHNILFLFLIFSVVPLPLVFMELSRSSGLDKFKIQPKVRLSSADIFRCYKDVMSMFFFVVGPLQLVSYPSIKVHLCGLYAIFWISWSGFWILWFVIFFSIACFRQLLWNSDIWYMICRVWIWGIC